MLKALFILVSLISVFSCKKYDIIIIGGGSSSETYAWRMDQYGDKDILILDKAGDESNNPDIQLIDVNSLSVRKNGNHNPLTVIDTREPTRNDFNYLQAKALGGIFAIGGVVYYRFNPLEFANWQNFAPVTGFWNYSFLEPGMKAIEGFADPLHPGAPISSARGTTGPLKILKNNGINDTSLASISNRMMSYFNAPFIPDVNDPQYTRIGLIESDRPHFLDANGNPQRSTIYISTLRARSNASDKRITIIPFATVVKIDWKVKGNTDQFTDNRLKAKRVYYVRNNEFEDAELKEGGILVFAAGGVGTSPLLEQNGIGNCTLLESLGIECLYNNSWVGENVRDHPSFGFSFVGTGLQDKNSAIMGMFAKSPVKPGNPNLADTRFSFWTVRTGTGTPTITCSVSMLESHSRGSIHIRHPSILYNPLLSLNYNFSTLDGDHFAWIANTTRAIFSTLGFTETSPGAAVPNGGSTAQLKTAMFPLIGTNYHNAGSCQMGRVVQEDTLRVFGTSNAYIIDHSVFPLPAMENPNGAIRALAYKAAEIHHRILDE